MMLRKNGAGVLQAGGIACKAGNYYGLAEFVIDANGTDYFEIAVYITATGSARTRTAPAALNYWSASAIR